METAITINSNQPGPTITIIGGIHGNERCGVNAIKRILPELKITKGKVHFLFGNPRAIKADVRFTEQNLNRMFRNDLKESIKNSYEYQRALYIKEFLDQSNVCLDLHASYTQPSFSFAISEVNANHITKFLPVKVICQNMDPFEPGGTDGYMFNQGKIGICVECGYLADPASDEIAYQSIETTLQVLGMTEHSNLVETSHQQTFSIFDVYHSKTDNFRLNQTWADFEKISQGTEIGQDGEYKISAKTDCYIVFARNLKKAGEEAFLLAKRENRLGR